MAGSTASRTRSRAFSIDDLISPSAADWPPTKPPSRESVPTKSPASRAPAQEPLIAGNATHILSHRSRGLVAASASTDLVDNAGSLLTLPLSLCGRSPKEGNGKESQTGDAEPSHQTTPRNHSQFSEPDGSER